MGKDTNGNGTAQKVQLLDEVTKTNTDFNSERCEYLFRTPFLVDSLKHLLKDERDVPMLCLALNILEVQIPGVIMVYCINTLWEPPLPLLVRNFAGLAYLISMVLLFQERFTLFIHFASHRTIFHNDYLNHAIGWVMAPFFGIPCGLYKLHHCVMHHIENNHELDCSSTEIYQRDSWADFGKYWFHFVVGIYVELPMYTIKTKKWDWFKTVSSGIIIYYCVIFLLAKYVSLLATTWVFVVHHIFAMSAMAFGNWSQHIFVNPEDRFSNYALTYNCIDCPGNKTTFNDGYHVIHHLNARLHWSELPQYFLDTREKHVNGGAMTFRGVHFIDVGILVMTKQLRKLAEKYVHIGPKETAPTVDEIEAKMRSWLVPVPRNESKKAD